MTTAPLALDPFAVATALVAVLTPGGTWTDGTYSGGSPVGTLEVVQDWTPDTPYDGVLSTPLVIVRPVQNVHDWLTASRKQDRGGLELLYRDAPLTQQQASDGAVTHKSIERALAANRKAIVTALDGHRSLDGAIVALGRIQEAYNPDGVEVSWDTSLWIGFSLLIEFMGPPITMTPTAG